jgi:CzcA family heavy metal efflux pump
MFALRHAKVLAFIAVALAVLGIRAYVVAPQSIFPPMSFARIDVVAAAGDLPPDRVRAAVTLPLERQLQTLPSLQRLRATSSQGAAEVLLDFDPHTDPRVDQQLTEAVLSTARADIPSAQRIDAVIVNANAEPVLSYALTSNVLSQAALRQFIDRRVVPAFAGIPGLSRVAAVGGPPVEYQVELHGTALAAAALSANAVATAIAQANDVRAVGSADRYHERYTLLVDAAIHDVPSLAALAVPTKDGATVSLGSIATIRLGTGVASAQAGTGGRHAVVLNVFPLAGADTVALARAANARFARVVPDLPADVRVAKYWDQTRLIVDSQASLRDAILLGALLAVVVIFLFLRDLRTTLVAAAIIPLAMATTIFVLSLTGQTLNLMSVGGLAIAVGLIIDDAIVVVEAIARGIAAVPERPVAKTVAAAVGRLAVPMVASTATTLVVFLPLGLLSGVSGFFFRALAFTLGSALVGSLALALVVTPILAACFIRVPREHVNHADDERDPLARRYRPVLRWALGRRGLVFGSAALVLVTTYLLLAHLPNDFLPSLDEGEFEIKYTLPPGATLAVSDAAAATMERIVRADPAVAAEGRLTGVDTNGYSPTLPNAGTIRVSLVTGARPSYDVISGRIRDAIADAVPAANLDIHQLLEDQINDLSGAPQPIEVTISGPDSAQLGRIAASTATAIGHVPGVVDAFNGLTYDDPTLRFVPQGARLAALGLAPGDLGDALLAGTLGSANTFAPSAGSIAPIPIRIRIAGSAPAAGAVGAMPLYTAGGLVPAGSLVAVNDTGLAPEINDENGREVVRVSANIAGASLSSVIAGVRRAIAEQALPPGYSATIGGAYQSQQASFREFLGVIGTAVALVYGVMLATFGSFRLPLVILGAIPLALIGVAVALAVTGTPINVSSFMGLLLLVGLVVKNGILLLDVANKRRLAGDDVTTALLTAGSTRVRPIVMTTLAAIGGLLPLAFGFGAGAEMERPLAIAVIGGLATATAFTLVVIPVLYATMMQRAPRSLAGAAATLACLLLMSAGARAQDVPAGSALFTAVSVGAAEDAALRASPDMRTAHAAVAGARAALASARGANGLSATAGYVEAPQGAPGGAITQRITSYGAQIALGDLLTRDPAAAAAEANLRAAEAAERSAEHAERLKVVNLYYAAVAARALLAASNDTTAGAQRFVRAAQTRFAAGDAPRIDILRARIAYARALADAAAARAQDANASDALASETTLPAQAFAGMGPPPAALPSPADPATAVARALALRAEVRSADDDVRAATADVSAARRATIPPITIGAGFEQGVDSGYPISGPALSIQMVVPLNGSVGAKIQAQQALLDAARAKRDAVERAIRVEVAAAARTAAAAVDAEDATGQALAAARAELDATTIGYRVGASSSLDATSARSVYRQAVIDDVTARVERLRTAALLDVDMSS